MRATGSGAADEAEIIRRKRKMLIASALLALLPGPVWPEAFIARFQENVPSKSAATNSGGWLYDWGSLRARFDHGDGQSNNFCQCARRDSSSCQLYFANDTSMWVNYPQRKFCCRLCKENVGCSVLRPDWLSGAAYVGNSTINGVACHTWSKRGAVAFDYWSQTDNGTACQYKENIVFARNVWHFMNFTEWRAVAPEDEDLRLPSHCETDCDSMYPKCH